MNHGILFSAEGIFELGSFCFLSTFDLNVLSLTFILSKLTPCIYMKNSIL